MFKLMKLKDVVKIPPSMLGRPLKETTFKILRDQYEGVIIPGIGFIISILDVEVSELGRIVPRDPFLYHPVVFKALVYTPLLHEVVEGEVTMVEEVGAFVRIGPIDGFMHKSQVYDDVFTYDRRQLAIIGMKSGKILRKGDIVRARIMGISMELEKTRGLRIGLTSRQHFLGKLEWIEEELKKRKSTEGNSKSK